eukprot:COSAG06_NODE_4020_length_4654_cov_2.838419_5_plen_118_part_00
MIKAVVETLGLMLEGTSQGNVTHQAEAIFAVSISDAHTLHLVNSGVLALIMTTLLTDQAELDMRIAKQAATGRYNSGYNYNVKAAREVMLGILLNLALSTHTAEAVAAHDGIGCAQH